MRSCQENSALGRALLSGAASGGSWRFELPVAWHRQLGGRVGGREMGLRVHVLLRAGIPTLPVPRAVTSSWQGLQCPPCSFPTSQLQSCKCQRDLPSPSHPKQGCHRSCTSCRRPLQPVTVAGAAQQAKLRCGAQGLLLSHLLSVCRRALARGDVIASGCVGASWGRAHPSRHVPPSRCALLKGKGRLSPSSPTQRGTRQFTLKPGCQTNGHSVPGARTWQEGQEGQTGLHHPERGNHGRCADRCIPRILWECSHLAGWQISLHLE